MSALMFFGEKFNEKNVINNFNKNDFSVQIPNKKLNEFDCSKILRNAGLPIVPSVLIHSAGELSSIFKRDNDKYVMKIVSSDIQHKTDIGGVILNIENINDAQKAYEKILSNVKKSAPQAIIDGVMVSPMIKGGIECILGAKIDPVFGPIVMFGLGGIYAEVMKDIAFAEAPLSEKIAEKMIASLKGRDLFYGTRGQLSVDIKSLVKLIVSMSNFIAANSDKVDQVEMNPVLVSEKQIIALDALIITK